MVFDWYRVIYRYMYICMIKSMNHNSLGCKQPYTTWPWMKSPNVHAGHLCCHVMSVNPVPQNVAWRNNSLRIVMILTDAGFKTALDGKVVSLVNVGLGAACNLGSCTSPIFYTT